uniref:Uncharacterized protein n=1 Tax=Plectus sambesii TaxID=2011161 RepID=A0A914XFS7_9BILA
MAYRLAVAMSLCALLVFVDGNRNENHRRFLAERLRSNLRGSMGRVMNRLSQSDRELFQLPNKPAYSTPRGLHWKLGFSVLPSPATSIMKLIDFGFLRKFFA